MREKTARYKNVQASCFGIEWQQSVSPWTTCAQRWTSKWAVNWQINLMPLALLHYGSTKWVDAVFSSRRRRRRLRRWLAILRVDGWRNVVKPTAAPPAPCRRQSEPTNREAALPGNEAVWPKATTSLQRPRLGPAVLRIIFAPFSCSAVVVDAGC